MDTLVSLELILVNGCRGNLIFSYQGYFLRLYFLCNSDRSWVASSSPEMMRAITSSLSADTAMPASLSDPARRAALDLAEVSDMGIDVSPIIR